MKLGWLSCLLIVLAGWTARAQELIDYSNYHVVFEENFDSIKTIEDLTPIWQFQHDDPGFGWGDYYDSATHITHAAEYYDKRMVSLRKRGVLRLSAKRVNGRDSVFSSWKKGWRTPMYRSGMIQMRLDLKKPGIDILNGESGFRYGMFEIRVNLPNGNDNFAAFWLTRAGRPTEIDIFEYGERPGVLSNNVIDFSTKKNKYSLHDTHDAESFEMGFHTIGCVWTPNEVVFYLDGVVTARVLRSEIATDNKGVLTLVANLGMRNYFSVRRQHMDIDYIRVYKPNGNNFDLPFTRPALEN